MFTVYDHQPLGLFFRPDGCLFCHIPAGHHRDNHEAPDQIIASDLALEYEAGQFFVCEACAREVARSLGMIEAEKADELRRKNRELGAENARLRQRQELLVSIETLLAAQ